MVPAQAPGPLGRFDPPGPSPYRADRHGEGETSLPHDSVPACVGSHCRLCGQLPPDPISAMRSMITRLFGPDSVPAGFCGPDKIFAGLYGPDTVPAGYSGRPGRTRFPADRPPPTSGPDSITAGQAPRRGGGGGSSRGGALRRLGDFGGGAVAARISRRRRPLFPSPPARLPRRDRSGPPGRGPVKAFRPPHVERAYRA